MHALQNYCIHLMDESASSHKTLTLVAPSFETPNTVPCLPVPASTHAPPARSPASSPPTTSSAGHTCLTTSLMTSSLRCADVSEAKQSGSFETLPVSSSENRAKTAENMRLNRRVKTETDQCCWSCGFRQEVQVALLVTPWFLSQLLVVVSLQRSAST